MMDQFIGGYVAACLVVVATIGIDRLPWWQPTIGAHAAVVVLVGLAAGLVGQWLARRLP